MHKFANRIPLILTCGNGGPGGSVGEALLLGRPRERLMTALRPHVSHSGSPDDRLKADMLANRSQGPGLGLGRTRFAGEALAVGARCNCKALGGTESP